jgi:hypothetical protein
VNDNDGRYKCGLCEKAFDDESERDRHVTFEPHCLKCGTADLRLLARGRFAGSGLCVWCGGEGTRREEESTLWH